MEILKDLVSQGLSGDELISRFAEQRANIKKAVGLLIDEADEIADGKRCTNVRALRLKTFFWRNRGKHHGSMLRMPTPLRG
jgi:hypothetical protein